MERDVALTKNIDTGTVHGNTLHQSLNISQPSSIKNESEGREITQQSNMLSIGTTPTLIQNSPTFNQTSSHNPVINKTLHLLQHYSSQLSQSTGSLLHSHPYKEQKNRLHELFGLIEKEFEIIWDENQELKKRIEELKSQRVSSPNFPTPTRKEKEPSLSTVSRLNPLKKKEREGVWEQLTHFIGHRDGIWDISTCKWEKNQNSFATASVDRTARVWSSDAASAVHVYKGHKGSVNSVRFHPTNRLLCTASGDGTCHIWKLPKTEERMDKKDAQLNTNASTTMGAALPPTAATVSANTPIASSHGAQPWTPLLNKGEGPDLSLLHHMNATGESIETSHMMSQQQQGQQDDHRNVSTLGVITITRPVFELKHRGVVMAADWLPTGDKIVTASWDNTLRFWNVENGRCISEALGHDSINDYFTNVTVAPHVQNASSSLVLTSSNDGYIRLWDWRIEKPLVVVIQAHSDVVRSAAFGVDDNLLISGGDDRTVKIWDRRNFGRGPRDSIRCSSSINRFSISPISSTLALPCDDRRVRIFGMNGRSMGRLRSKNGHKSIVTSCAWSFDESVIFTASFDRSVIAWAKKTTDKSIKSV